MSIPTRSNREVFPSSGCEGAVFGYWGGEGELPLILLSTFVGFFYRLFGVSAATYIFSHSNLVIHSSFLLITSRLSVLLSSDHALLFEFSLTLALVIYIPRSLLSCLIIKLTSKKVQVATATNSWDKS
jgi:hypothetical protein